MSKIKLSTSHLSGHELLYIQAAINSNEVSVYGDNLTGFENDLENYLQKNAKVACTISGTAAIHLALILANVSQNDEVLCQSMTYAASVNPVVYQYAIPVFVGSEKDTWNMCPEALEEAIKDRNIVEVADALTDILYVTYGAGHAFGIDLDKCFNEVQESNMSKLGEDNKPIYNENGKVMKGPHYFKPNLNQFLK